MKRALGLGSVAALASLAACGQAPEPPQMEIAVEEVAAEEAAKSQRAAARERAVLIFGTLPDEVPNPANPISEEKIALGRMLFFDTRLSKNHDVSCNSCHDLARFGVDGEPTSAGHRGQRRDRNSPTVYNAALHIAQFWDGRAADVEEQAGGPVLNPVEMAMPSEEATVAVLRSIPGYEPLFRSAFPDAADPISYDNMAETGPYFHDGSVGSIEQAIRLMAKHPLGRHAEPRGAGGARGIPDQLDGQSRSGVHRRAGTPCERARHADSGSGLSRAFTAAHGDLG